MNIEEYDDFNEVSANENLFSATEYEFLDEPLSNNSDKQKRKHQYDVKHRIELLKEQRRLKRDTDDFFDEWD